MSSVVCHNVVTGERNVEVGGHCNILVSVIGWCPG